MRFWEAMKALEEGKKVRPLSRSWDKESSPFDSKLSFINYCTHIPGILYEENWELYEEPEQLLDKSIKSGKDHRKSYSPEWTKISEERPPAMVTILLCIERNGKRDVTCGWDESDTPECDPCFVCCDPGIDLSDYEVVAWMLLPEHINE